MTRKMPASARLARGGWQIFDDRVGARILAVVGPATRAQFLTNLPAA